MISSMEALVTAFQDAFDEAFTSGERVGVALGKRCLTIRPPRLADEWEEDIWAVDVTCYRVGYYTYHQELRRMVTLVRPRYHMCNGSAVYTRDEMENVLADVVYRDVSEGERDGRFQQHCGVLERFDALEIPSIWAIPAVEGDAKDDAPNRYMWRGFEGLPPLDEEASRILTDLGCTDLEDTYDGMGHLWTLPRGTSLTMFPERYLDPLCGPTNLLSTHDPQVMRRQVEDLRSDLATFETLRRILSPYASGGS